MNKEEEGQTQHTPHTHKGPNLFFLPHTAGMMKVKKTYTPLGGGVV